MFKLFFFTGCVLSFVFLAFLFQPEWDNRDKGNYDPGRIPIAILGDSDSHTYRDTHLNIHRGGKYHNITFQWTGILERLRQSEVDLGQFGHWGTRGTIYRIRSFLGLSARMPRKQDYEYNFAFSGATCGELSPESYQKQSYLASKLISRKPRYWDNGLVIIRMGINDIGQWSKIKKYVDGNVTSEIRKPIINCVKHIQNAAQLIRRHHSSVKIILVGIMDNSNWPLGIKTDDISHNNINKILDVFDNGLRSIAANDVNMLFVDDRKWYEHTLGYWESGKYIGDRLISLGGNTVIVNKKGNHPFNIILSDKHAGTVANALWIRNLFQKINLHFGFGITPLLDSEIAELINPNGQLEMMPTK